jgi:hypothetical protein
VEFAAIDPVEGGIAAKAKLIVELLPISGLVLGQDLLELRQRRRIGTLFLEQLHLLGDVGRNEYAFMRRGQLQLGAEVLDDRLTGERRDGP